LPPIAGAAVLRFASSAKANPAAMPGLSESPAAKVRKSQSPRQIDTPRYPSLGQLTPPQKSVCRTFRNRGKRSNIMDMADVSGIKSL
jgi:hypothetical protein